VPRDLGSVGQGSNGPPVPSRWSASQGQRRSEGCGSSIGAYTDRYAARCFHRGKGAHSWERWGCTLDEKLGSTFILPPLSRRQSGTNIGKKTGQGDAEGSGRQGWQNVGSNNVQWKSIQNESAAWDGGWRVQKLRATGYESWSEHRKAGHGSGIVINNMDIFASCIKDRPEWPQKHQRRTPLRYLTQWVPAGVPEGTRRSSGDAVKKQRGTGPTPPVVKPPRNQHRVRAGARGWLSLNPDAPILPKRTHMEGRSKGLKENREGKKGGWVDSRRIKADANAEAQRRVFGLCTEWQETSVGIHI
jgi:hypothetical protein